jgi:hypothetical protein
MHDIQTMSPTELEQEYGIEIDSDTGEVWDPCEMKTFDGLDEWAVFMEQMEKEDAALAASSLKTNVSKRRYEDD